MFVLDLFPTGMNPDDEDSDACEPSCELEMFLFFCALAREPSSATGE